MIYHFFSTADHNHIPTNRKLCVHNDCSGSCINSWAIYGRTSLQELFLMLIEFSFAQDMIENIKNNLTIILEYDENENFCRIVPKIEFEKFLILL